METSKRTSGTVRFFSDSKGYGFIEPDGGGGDVFVHYSQPPGKGYRMLDEGERVEFEVVTTAKGLQAENVTRVKALG